MSITLIHWISLCKEASKILTADPTVTKVSTLLCSHLSTYIGCDLPRTTLSTLKPVLRHLLNIGAIIVNTTEEDAKAPDKKRPAQKTTSIVNKRKKPPLLTHPQREHLALSLHLRS